MLTTKYTTVVSNLLAGNASYMPNYLYVEFTNDTVIIPESYQDPDYYKNGIPNTAGYLRIPITIKPTVSDNKITYTVLATNTISSTDVSFGNGSTIYGVALVSAPDSNDPNGDIVFAREYFTDPSKQLVMTNNQTFCFSFQLAVFDNAPPEEEELVWNNE